LGHVISKDEILVDYSRIEAIEKISLPKDRKDLQFFFGKVNFIRRFIPNFVEIVKPLIYLLKKDVPFEWENNGKRDFQLIKKAITIAHILISLEFTKYFIIFSFTLKDTITSVLLKKNDEGNEKRISFMRRASRDSKLNCTITEKHTYSLVKSLNHFRAYVGYNKIIAFIPEAVNDFLS
jgi:hypothetical protein